MLCPTALEHLTFKTLFFEQNMIENESLVCMANHGSIYCTVCHIDTVFYMIRGINKATMHMQKIELHCMTLLTIVNDHYVAWNDEPLKNVYNVFEGVWPDDTVCDYCITYVEFA